MPQVIPMSTKTSSITISSVHDNFPLALLLSSLAGLSTGLGGLLMTLHPNLTSHHLGMWQGAAAGFMLSVSFFDLFPTALEDLDLFPACIFFLIGGVFFYLLTNFLPEPDLSGFKTDASKRHILWSGLVTALGISIHNFPEGIAVCVASLKGIRFGLPLALAIGLHNIPEGMAVALPLMFATKDNRYAVKMAFLSGLAEPIGVIFLLLIIHLTGYITKTIIAASLSVVAGIMVVLSLIELIPQSIQHCGKQNSFLSTILGLFIMTCLLKLIQLTGWGI